MKKLVSYFLALIELPRAFFLSRRFIWNSINHSAIKGFKESKPKLSIEEEAIVKKLPSLIKKKDLDFFHSKILEKIQLFHQTLRPVDSDVKTFLKYYLGGDFRNSRQKFTKLNPLLEFSFNEKLATIVNSYFKMLSKLCYLEINETIISNANKNLKSQKFHRDPGIDKCIKVFVYLNDVDKYSGPFTYVKRSHSKDSNTSIRAKRFGAGGIYPDEEIFKRTVDKDLVIPIYGKAGTVIIADTTGLHCGGNSIKKTRKMATIVFYPPGDLIKSKIDCTVPQIEKLFPVSSYLLPK